MATDGAAALISPADELNQLRQENDLLRAQRDQLLEQQQHSTRTIEQLQHQLQQLLRRMYGRSSEKIDPKQMALFEELMEKIAPATSTSSDAGANDASAAGESTSSPPSARNGHGRGRLPSTL